MVWNKKIKPSEITDCVTEETVRFAEEFGRYLAEGRNEKLTTNQLRKFFGEVKRQQMVGYKASELVLLKPKLAYAVGRANKDAKIKDFYVVMCDAIDKVKDEKHFRNFIKFFEAIVAYHKAYEENRL